uniref:Right handed beta helix domain-containing protein n=1 Tax=Haptolina brevifila TaxID=156173 RepID=A0A7S2FP30_9EUKA
MADMQLTNAFGPCAICVAGILLPPVGLFSTDTHGTRVDIVQITRLTANNGPPSKPDAGNASVIWLDIGGGCNTIRLDNVGFINGGTGVRMESGATEPAGLYPGRPLFLFANDLEIDFPSGHALELLRGEEVQLSNAYVQGAGSTNYVDRRANDSSLGVGLHVGPKFSSELMVTNCRFFGHALSAIELAGGAHATIGNNIISENSIATPGKASGILVRPGVSDFIIQGNHVGTLTTTTSTTRYGIEIQPGASDRYVVTANTLTGNVKGGLRDYGEGKAKSVVGNVL